MSTMYNNDRHLTGYRGDTTTHDVSQTQYQSYYENNMGHYNPNLLMSDDDTDEDIEINYDDDYHDFHDEEVTQEEEEVEEEDDSGSELSVPDPNIDFAMVYALHTFTATVEGQATVVRGDALTLLDDSNSYWWLVKVLNTSVVGYIPAENIETPYERLARLNSHRNVELTRRDIQDAFPNPPSTKPKQLKRVTLAKGVQFQSQIIYGSSDDEDDDFQAEFEQWNERMNSDDSDSGEESDDPYQYYEDSHRFSDDQHPVDLYTSSPTQMDIEEDTKKPNRAQSHLPDEEPIDYYSSPYETDQPALNLGEETIKISLTPTIARDDGLNRDSDSHDIQTKLRKAAELEQLLVGSPPSPEPLQQQRRNSKDKNEKFGLRKLFSRNKKSRSTESLERRASYGSNHDETGSLSSQSTSVHERPSSVQPTQIQVFAGNISDFGDAASKDAFIFPSTTALELIHQLVPKDNDDALIDDTAYHDYYLVLKTGTGENTLVPSDKPLEIYNSLTAHLSTPMPSLKKARRISQMMKSETSIMGEQPVVEEEKVQFYLFSKTKQVDEGEIQIKVSLISSESGPERRVDKLVKIPANVIVKDAITLLLEKFHILNGISAGVQEEEADVQSLRLDGDEDVVKYELVMSHGGNMYPLAMQDKLIHAFEDNPPPIQHRRNSHPDRTSITVNIAPPDENELYFVLRRIVKAEPIQKRRLVRQNTPNPRSHHHGAPAAHISHSSMEDTLQKSVRPESTDSLFYCQDFGMNELMVLIRGAAHVDTTKPSYVRSEINDLFKDSQTRLDQLEKELDRIMTEAVKAYP